MSGHGLTGDRTVDRAWSVAQAVLEESPGVWRERTWFTELVAAVAGCSRRDVDGALNVALLLGHVVESDSPLTGAAQAVLAADTAPHVLAAQDY